MPGLGLDRFERHAGLAQPSEARVSELVTGRVLEPTALASAPCPKPVLLFPVVSAFRANQPMPVLEEPLVRAAAALCPMAVLVLPVPVALPAPFPMNNPAFVR